MKKLITYQWYETKSTGGRFERTTAQFRNWVTKDGAPGPTGIGGFSAEPNRYHLYVSLACPWAHRTLIFRKIKGLVDHIPIAVVHPYMGPNGWDFEIGDGVIPPTFGAFDRLGDVYIKHDSNFTGRVTVPVLWDSKTEQMVNNESAQIIRMFNSAFNDVGANEHYYYPKLQFFFLQKFHIELLFFFHIHLISLNNQLKCKYDMDNSNSKTIHHLLIREIPLVSIQHLLCLFFLLNIVQNEISLFHLVLLLRHLCQMKNFY